MKKLTFLLAATLGLCGGCKVQQPYKVPTAPTAEAYHPVTVEAASSADNTAVSKDWKQATPSDGALKSNWWEIFHDATLDQLEAHIEVDNQTLKMAAARYAEARTLVSIRNANRKPTLGIGGDVERDRDSMNQGVPPPVGESDFNDFRVGLTAAWEPDLWGRIGLLIRTSTAQAQASAADLENARLSLHAELAADYLYLRSLDNERKILADSVATYARALQMVEDRYKGGLANRVDLEQAQTQYEAASAQERDLDEGRAHYLHAIAVLTGQAPEGFDLPSLVAPLTPPEAPVGLPSDLLERRPDIAAAERRVAAANSQIGLARTAFYPQVILSGALGLDSKSLSTWFFAPSRYWSVGPLVSQTLFDGGRRRASLAQSQSSYDETVAAYRQSVLTALEQVEDNLASLRILADEAERQQRAVAAARRAEDLSLHRYEGGMVTYLEVTSTQSTRLQNERIAVGIEHRRMAASVALIRALGGGWQKSSLPSPADFAVKMK